MASKKDQLQAYQFLLQRVVSALAVQETDPELPPYRRPTTAAVGGVVITAIALLVMWVFGLVVPGNRPFTATDVVAVEKETGARHVLIDGRLHPVANYTSALLALDRPAAVRSVSRRSLEGVPRGSRIGIAGAPDALPDAKSLLTGGWSSCSRPGLDETGARTEESLLLVGHTPDGGTQLGDRALLVRAGDTRYLVVRGYRHELTAKADVALDLGRETEVSVTSTWLDVLPRGEPIGPVPVAGVGRRSTAVPGLRLTVGQLLEVDDGTGTEADRQRYLVLPRQLQLLTPLQAQVQEVAGGADDPAPVSRQEVGRATATTPRPPAAGDPPRTRPDFAPVGDPRSPVCATYDPAGFVPRVVVGAALDAAEALPGGAVVPPGKGTLVEVVASPDQPAGQGTVALVTDDGRLYPLSAPDHVRQVLGYDGVDPVRIAQPLAARLPPGPALDPAAARRPLSSG